MSELEEAAHEYYQAKQQRSEAQQKMNEARKTLEEYLERSDKRVFDLENSNHLFVQSKFDTNANARYITVEVI